MNDETLSAVATDAVEVTGTAGQSDTSTLPQDRIEEAAVAPRPIPGKKRAGITKNKGNGQSKSRRKMAKASRRQNRK